MELLVVIKTRLGFYVHLWIEDAGRSFDDTHGRVVRLELVNKSFLTLDNSHNLKAKILRVHVRREGIWQALLSARGDLDAILGTCEIADNGHRGVCSRRQWLQRCQDTANQGDLNWFGLIVREVEDRLRCAPIYQLNSKDLSIRELDIHRDS